MAISTSTRPQVLVPPTELGNDAEEVQIRI